MIKVSNRDIQKIIGITGAYASFSDLVDLPTGNYKLAEQVGEAYSKSPGSRTKADKELMKVDERVNILYTIYTGGSHENISSSRRKSELGVARRSIKDCT